MSPFPLKLALLILAAVAVECNQGQDGASYLHDSNRVHDAEHIREHMKGYMETPEELKLDDQEAMEFHYFKLHDYDNNNKLDGLELGAAMTHYEDHRQEEGEGHKMRSVEISDDELKNLIDAILRDDDLNNDGYIDYYEFTQAQRKHQGDNNTA